jgi:hypothetical protein
LAQCRNGHQGLHRTREIMTSQYQDGRRNR